MFGYSGDDLANFWGLIGVGVALGTLAVTLAHRIWRALFFGLAALFLLSGLLSGQIKAFAPAFARALSQVTANPSNWFLVFMVLVAGLWLRQFRKETLRAADAALLGSATEAWIPEVGARLEAVVKAQTDLLSEIARMRDSITSIGRQVDKFTPVIVAAARKRWLEEKQREFNRTLLEYEEGVRKQLEIAKIPLGARRGNSPGRYGGGPLEAIRKMVAQAHEDLGLSIDLLKSPNFDGNPHVTREGDADIADDALRHEYRRIRDRVETAKETIGAVQDGYRRAIGAEDNVILVAGRDLQRAATPNRG